ncbi:hypothetical protein [Aureispira anguillae]|uniref:Uncharacterized protein n=1 Tax=Aureispira anguillae TaxID=2864201 RepID=A0A915YHE0_9BACT|nr:hypothetical protein [Aureispira anguillae]BDS12991.1 hypothetical protein AsAng_0037190 [Aureispira anguillae]BDS13054.1 hypothetical protein AsAng_0037820 [Aureispira anguillae]
MSLRDKIKLDYSRPDFSQYGTGRIREQPKNTEEASPSTQKSSGDPAAIINASANGLNSIGGVISLFMGKDGSNSTTTTPPPPPPPKKQLSPLAIGGIIGGVVLLIVVLISSKNGKASEAIK